MDAQTGLTPAHTVMRHGCDHGHPGAALGPRVVGIAWSLSDNSGRPAVRSERVLPDRRRSNRRRSGPRTEEADSQSHAHRTIAMGAAPVATITRIGETRAQEASGARLAGLIGRPEQDRQLYVFALTSVYAVFAANRDFDPFIRPT